MDTKAFTVTVTVPALDYLLGLGYRYTLPPDTSLIRFDAEFIPYKKGANQRKQPPIDTDAEQLL